MFEKTQKKTIEKINWKQQSIFFNLAYRCKLDVRHYIDVMHVEKIFYDCVIGTLLNIKEKTKDGVKTRQDLFNIGIGIRGVVSYDIYKSYQSSKLLMNTNNVRFHNYKAWKFKVLYTFL